MHHTFLVHCKGDLVGVVVKDIEPRQQIFGRLLDGTSDAELEEAFQAKDQIPLGHKVALRNIEEGEDIIEYGRVIGRALTRIEAGSHVHTHNIKSKRW